MGRISHVVGKKSRFNQKKVAGKKSCGQTADKNELKINF
jgi:hypothetical protein